MGELGDMLREARERKEVSPAEVEEETKIRERFIKALEEEDYAILPQRIYTKGLLKNYARYLGLDTSEVMRLFGEEEGTPTPIPPASQALASPPLLSPDLIVILVIFMALGLFGFWVYHQYLAPVLIPLLATPTMEASSPTPEVTATRTPLPSPTFTPTEVVTTGLHLEIEILTRTWLEVIIDGEETFRGLVEAGETQTWSANEVIALHVGNAAGLRVVLCGQEMPPLGEAGEVVDVEWRVEDFLTPTPAIGPPLTPAETPTMTAAPTITVTATITATPTITSTLPPSPTPTQ